MDSKYIKKIEVVPYDTNWPKMYEAETIKIKTALGDNFVSIYHVGSTSVPGLAAKPKIDIIAEVKNGNLAIKTLSPAGFEYKGEWNIPFKFGFTKREGTSVNLHVYEEGHPEVELNLQFRDFLRSNDDIRDEYASLKTFLLQDEASFKKQKGQRFSGYNLGKDAFITKILKRTEFNRLRFLKCTHHNERDAAKKFRKEYFFNKVPMNDPYIWTFDHEDHEHFILYKGMEIIGYAHIQLCPEHRAAVRIIVIDSVRRGKFMQLIEKWLTAAGYQSVHVESSPNALNFYKNLGYIDMPFNDPDGYEGSVEDTELGKFL